jgi:outer membrane protein W
MRKIVLLFLAVLLLSAQKYDKSFYLTGEFSMNSSDVEDKQPNVKFEYEQESKILNSTIGYYLTNNIGIGLIVNIASSTSTGEQTQIAIGPSLRYTFYREKLSPFIQASYVKQSDERDVNGSTSTYEQENYVFSAGASYYLDEWISILSQVDYMTGNIDTGQKITTIENPNGDGSTLRFDLTNLSLTFGISLHF